MPQPFAIHALAGRNGSGKPTRNGTTSTPPNCARGSRLGKRGSTLADGGGWHSAHLPARAKRWPARRFDSGDEAADAGRKAGFSGPRALFKAIGKAPPRAERRRSRRPARMKGQLSGGLAWSNESEIEAGGTSSSPSRMSIPRDLAELVDGQATTRA
jgi:hypothetical protein